MTSFFDPLIQSAIGSASKTVNSKQQMALLDQTKTVAECALQLIYASKEAGGNPKVRHIFKPPLNKKSEYNIKKNSPQVIFTWIDQKNFMFRKIKISLNILEDCIY